MSKVKPLLILAPVSLGELIDKITILEIKAQLLSGQARRNVTRELEALQTALAPHSIQIETKLQKQLKATNLELWGIEEALRTKEKEQDFGADFICLARSVYQVNDRRAAIKKQINRLYNSFLVEEKSYSQQSRE